LLSYSSSLPPFYITYSKNRLKSNIKVCRASRYSFKISISSSSNSIVSKIFDHKEKELISLEKGYFIDIKEGEVLFSPKHISPIIKKIW
jgi:hypothetical protein